MAGTPRPDLLEGRGKLSRAPRKLVEAATLRLAAGSSWYLRACLASKASTTSGAQVSTGALIIRIGFWGRLYSN